MMRLDKYLADCGQGSRSILKEKIRKGRVTVNGITVKQSDYKIQEDTDTVCMEGVPVTYRKYAYYLLHKPAGTVCAVKDNTAPTVLSLLNGVTDKGLFPVGRLDKDTTGLLLITNDGPLAHYLLSPARHVDKTYLVTPKNPLSEEALKQLAEGVDIGDDTGTLPARAELLPETGQLFLTIREGRYHQVKRMLKAVGNEVLALKRCTFGPLVLEKDPAPGCFRPLTGEEIQKLRALMPKGTYIPE